MLASGPFGSVFDRMLFLTATPFQLGHHELARGSSAVRRRFAGVTVSSGEAFQTQLVELERALDAAQTAALRLDRRGGGSRPRIVADSTASLVAEIRECQSSVTRARRRHAIGDVRGAGCASRGAASTMGHPACSSGPGSAATVRPGRAILDDERGWIARTRGGEAVVLPFLLAARAQALVCLDRAR